MKKLSKKIRENIFSYNIECDDIYSVDKFSPVAEQIRKEIFDLEIKMTVIGPITIGTEPKAHLPGKRYLITKNSVAEMDYIATSDWPKS